MTEPRITGTTAESFDPTGAPSTPPASPAADPASAEPPARATPAAPGPGAGRRRPRRRTIVLAAVAVAVVAIVGGLAWFFMPQPLLPEATAALASTPGATYSEEAAGLTFVPKDASAKTGLILYPGAKVPAAAYAPAARAIAEEGYLVVVVPMPLNFAIFGVNAADQVIAAHPEIQSWAIGGHSLGGAMAAQYAAGHPGAISGLALCGAYSASDLSGSGMAASSVYGSLDAAAPKIEDPATEALLPASTVYDRIEGGNHEQCGWYTGQPNDPPATVSRADQQTAMIGAWTDLLAGMRPRP
jgi:dienelactone hydrolase